MADNNKFNAPDGPPPNYPKPVHQDAGPYYPQNSQSPAPFQDPHQQPYYGSPAPQGQWEQNQQQYPPQGGYYQPQQPMYYQQQPYGQPGYGQQQYGGRPMYGGAPGYYGDQRGGAGGGICAGILAAMACCCCFDMMF